MPRWRSRRWPSAGASAADVFWELHSGLPREGPGSDDSTREALRLVGSLPHEPLILDVGCGPGMQTLVLARETYGRVIAVDRHQPYLDELNRRATRQWLADRIRTVNASMRSLDFPDASFDLIWSEGAIYVMGFETGLREWKRLLKPGGAIAVTEVSWLGPPVPDDVKRFWTAAYPAMSDVARNLGAVERAGYTSLGHFVLPESAWWDDYYTPIEARIAELKDKYREEPTALEFLSRARQEIDLHRRGAGSYGYVFYVARTTESEARP